MIASQNSATEKCEKILLKSKKYNIEHSILPSENIVIDRLINSKENMESVYMELGESLDERQIDVFLSVVLSCAAFWNPEKAVTYRAERKELIETNKAIAKVASNLVELLDKRDQLHNCSGFSSNTHYFIIDVIEKASSENPLFRSYIQEPLSCLGGRFDLKYWPSIEDVISELAVDAENAETYATDLVTEASTISNRASKADFLRALFSAIRKNSNRHYGLIPNQFSISDRSIAEIMNSALGLDVEELVDAGYVKRARQREREQNAENA